MVGPSQYIQWGEGMNGLLKVGIIVTSLILALPILSAAQVKRSEIRIGVSTSLSGPFGGIGQEGLAGNKYAVEDVNKAGGISVAEGANLPVRLIVYDDKSDQTISVGNIERLITADKVDFLFGAMATPIIMANAGVAERHGIPHITAGTPVLELHMGKLLKWTWVIFHRIDLQYSAIPEMLDAIASNITKKMALWRENTILGELVEKFGLPLFKASGWQTIVLPYTMGAKDLTDLIVKSKQAEVSLIIGAPTLVDAVTGVRQMRELGYLPQMIVWPRGASDAKFRDALGSDADYVADSVGWSPNIKYPGNHELSERYRKDTGRTAAAVLGPSYACAQVLFDAIKRAKTLDRTKMKEAIQKTDLMTVNGRLIFPAQGSPAVKIVMNQWQRGKYVTIWPSELAEAKPLFPMPPWNER